MFGEMLFEGGGCGGGGGIGGGPIVCWRFCHYILSLQSLMVKAVERGRGS